MKKLLLLTLALAAITAHGQELIVNGDFETDAVTAGGFTYVSDGGNSITGWTLVDLNGSDAGTGVDVDLVGEGVTMSWAGTTASQCVDLNGLIRGAIEQVVATAPASDYLVTFKYSWNQDGSISARHDRSFFVQVRDGSTIIESLLLKPMGMRFPNEGSTKTNDAPVWHSAGWTETNFTFTATKSAHTLRLYGGRNRESGGPLIDDVSVTAVP